jgi:hypothetical protein
VEDSVLIHRSRSDGSFLRTIRDDFKDFHLRLETRVGDRTYSQIIVRDVFGQSGSLGDGYRVVLNSNNADPEKTGSLNAGRGHVVVTVGYSPIPPNQWFTLEVIVEGNHVVVKVNGQTTADYEDPERRFARGHITLVRVSPERDGRNPVEFRKIEIKELDATDAEPSAVDSNKQPLADKQGFVPLFNGKDKTGWQSDPKEDTNWEVNDGVLVYWSRSNMSFLSTSRDDFKDFHLRAETRIGDGAYAQLKVRDAASRTGIHDEGYSVVLNSTNRNPQKTGALAAGGGRGVAAKVGHTPIRPHQWFVLEVIARGNHVTVKVNGRTTADYEDPEQRFTHGCITLLGVSPGKSGERRVEFRKIEIKELTAHDGDAAGADRSTERTPGPPP